VPGSIVTLFVVGLLGAQEPPAEAAGVSGQGDAGLDRAEAARAVFAVALAEGGAVLGEAPRDAHQRVAVFGEALAADPAAARDGCDW